MRRNLWLQYSFCISYLPLVDWRMLAHVGVLWGQEVAAQAGIGQLLLGGAFLHQSIVIIVVLAQICEQMGVDWRV